jgi:hypothetical protein
LGRRAQFSPSVEAGRGATNPRWQACACAPSGRRAAAVLPEIGGACVATEPKRRRVFSFFLFLFSGFVNQSVFFYPGPEDPIRFGLETNWRAVVGWACYTILSVTRLQGSLRLHRPIRVKRFSSARLSVFDLYIYKQIHKKLYDRTLPLSSNNLTQSLLQILNVFASSIPYSLSHDTIPVV